MLKQMILVSLTKNKGIVWDWFFNLEWEMNLSLVMELYF